MCADFFVGEIKLRVKVFRVSVSGMHVYIRIWHRQSHLLPRRSEPRLHLTCSNDLCITDAVLHRHAVLGDRNVIVFKSDRTHTEIVYWRSIRRQLVSDTVTGDTKLCPGRFTSVVITSWMGEAKTCVHSVNLEAHVCSHFLVNKIRTSFTFQHKRSLNYMRNKMDNALKRIPILRKLKLAHKKSLETIYFPSIRPW